MQSLKERTFLFAQYSIDLVKILSKDSYTQHISNQFFRCATSVGANYREADGADSRREFRHRMSIAKKEAKESYYWLGLLHYMNKTSGKEINNRIDTLIAEAKALSLIFSKIVYDLK